MSQRANVTSLDPLDTFRAKLLVYVSQARAALEEVGADVTRVRLWLENDQRSLWESELRRRSRKLEDAQQALFSAKMSSLRTESSAEQLAFHRAKHQVEDAEQRLRVIRKWARDYDNRVQPLLKQMEKLHSVLSNDMIQAAAYLSQAIRTLSDYAEIKSSAPELPSAPTQPNAAGTADEKAGPTEGTPTA